jgi:hypothetical protein
MIEVLLLEKEYNGLDSKGLKVGILGFLMSMTQMWFRVQETFELNQL